MGQLTGYPRPVIGRVTRVRDRLPHPARHRRRGHPDLQLHRRGDYLMYVRAVDDDGLGSERQSAPFSIIGP